jgi:hypothetical protein
VSYLHTFWVCCSRQDCRPRVKKLDDRSTPMVFLGYEDRGNISALQPLQRAPACHKGSDIREVPLVGLGRVHHGEEAEGEVHCHLLRRSPQQPGHPRQRRQRKGRKAMSPQDLIVAR